VAFRADQLELLVLLAVLQLVLQPMELLLLARQLELLVVLLPVLQLV
jgi:hypothetical protein